MFIVGLSTKPTKNTTEINVRVQRIVITVEFYCCCLEDHIIEIVDLFLNGKLYFTHSVLTFFFLLSFCVLCKAVHSCLNGIQLLNEIIFLKL